MKVHKTIGESRANLGTAVGVIPARYKTSTARASWAEPAASTQAEDNYQAGIAEAIAEDRRRKGVAAAGDAEYRKGCADKGAAVIAKRITDSLPKYEAAFSPVLTAMNTAADAAPARTRDVDTNIEQRLKPVVRAARAAVGK